MQLFCLTYLSGLRSSLCARLCARAPLTLLLRCSSLFCWMRASSLEIVPIPNMESLIPYGTERERQKKLPLKWISREVIVYALSYTHLKGHFIKIFLDLPVLYRKLHKVSTLGQCSSLSLLSLILCCVSLVL